MKLKRTGLVTKIVILLLAVYAVVSLTNMHGRINDARQDQERLAAEAKSLAASNAALEYEIAHSSDVETIENIAREKLGLVLPGETVYYDIGD